MINLELTIDRIEGDKAVLISQDQESIVWPKSKLPEGAQAGDVLYFSAKNLKEKSQSQQALAKDILNEILDV